MNPQEKIIWQDRKRTFLGLPWSFTRYYLTEKKLITRIGFFTIKEDEVELYRVIDKSLSETLWQRIFKLGTIKINCRDTDTPVKTIFSVKRPHEVMAQLEQYVDQQRDKYRTRGRDMYGGVIDNDDCDCDCHDGIF